MDTTRLPTVALSQIEKIQRLNALFFELYDKSPVLLEIEVFLIIVKNNGLLSQVALKEIIGKIYKSVNDAHISRYLYSLGEGKISATSGKREPGKGLIETKRDPENYSRRLVFLTQKGEELTAKILEIMRD